MYTHYKSGPVVIVHKDKWMAWNYYTSRKDLGDLGLTFLHQQSEIIT